MSPEAYLHTWDSVLTSVLANASRGLSLQHMEEAFPPGLAVEWLRDARRRGLVECSGDLWTLTPRGRQMHRPSPRSIVVGLPDE